MSRSTTLVALRTAVVALAGYADASVLLSYGDRPRPAAPHLFIWVVDDAPASHALLGGTTVTQRRDLTVQIDARGAWTADSAVALLERLSVVLGSETPAAMGVAVQSIAPVLDGTRLAQGAWTPVTAFRVVVQYEASHEAAPVPLLTAIRPDYVAVADGTEYTADGSIVVAEESP